MACLRGMKVSNLTWRFLLHPVNEDDKADDRENPCNHSNQCSVIHSSPRLDLRTTTQPFIKCAKKSLRRTIAGPTTTTPIAGKMQKTRGGTSLIVVLAALSSAFCRRCVRNASEKAPNDLAIGVPNRSV